MLERLIYYPFVILILILSAGGWANDGDYFGRLFTSPEQRDRIDAIRYAPEPEPEEMVTIEPVEPEPAPQELPVNIKLRGMVRSNSGEPVYWINDSNSMQADFLQENLTVLPGKNGSRQVQIRLPDDRIIPLQIGESYTPGIEEAPQTDTRRMETRDR